MDLVNKNDSAGEESPKALRREGVQGRPENQLVGRRKVLRQESVLKRQRARRKSEFLEPPGSVETQTLRAPTCMSPGPLNFHTPRANCHPSQRPALASAFPFSEKGPQAHQPEAQSHSRALPRLHVGSATPESQETLPPPVPPPLPAEQSLQHGTPGLHYLTPA